MASHRSFGQCLHLLRRQRPIVSPLVSDQPSSSLTPLPSQPHPHKQLLQHQHQQRHVHLACHHHHAVLSLPPLLPSPSARITSTSADRLRYKSKKSRSAGSGGSKKRGGGSAGAAQERDDDELADEDGGDDGRGGGGSGGGGGAKTYDAARVDDMMQRSRTRCEESLRMLTVGGARGYVAILDALRVPMANSSGDGGKGTPSAALKELANVGVRQGSIVVSVFDPSNTKSIEKAIHSSPLQLHAQPITGGGGGGSGGGEVSELRVSVPTPTSESRQRVAKEVARVCESARQGVRAARHEAQRTIRALEKATSDAKAAAGPGWGKQQAREAMDEVEAMTKRHNAEIEKLQQRYQEKAEKGE